MYRFQRHYQGPVQAVIFDWAGTVVDYGSFAPTQVLTDAFAGFGVSVSLEEARQPMGLPKREHIRALGRIPAVAARWREHHGRDMTAGDVDAVYARFMPLQVERVGEYSQVIPGVVEVVEALRARGVRLGSTSGYPRAVMDRLVPQAEAHGLHLDHAVAADDLKPGGRPGPWMALENVIQLGVRDLCACVKVDDTEPGIQEGLNAGMWTVGVALSGNEVGLSLGQVQDLPVAERTQLRDRAAERLLGWGAHEVVDTVAELPGVLARIEERLARGWRP